MWDSQYSFIRCRLRTINVELIMCNGETNQTFYISGAWLQIRLTLFKSSLETSINGIEALQLRNIRSGNEPQNLQTMLYLGTFFCYVH